MKDKRIALKILKYMIIISTIILIGKLLWISVMNKNVFTTLAKNQTTIETTEKFPRGKILDRDGQVIVDERELNNLMYIESGLLNTKQKTEIIKKIAPVIEINDLTINEIELKDFILNQNNNLKKILNNLTEEEQNMIKSLSNADYNNFLRSKVTNEMINEIKIQYGDEELYILLKTKQATAKKAIIIKKDISIEEYYAISKISEEIGGFYITKDYERTYPHGDLMRSFLGTVGQIPQEQVELYESLGYAKNALVGISYVEQAMENVLKSNDRIVGFNFDENGNIIDKVTLKEGKKGNNLYLTIDLEIQKKVEEQLTQYLKNNNYEYNKNIQTTIVDPSTGDLIAFAGKMELDDGTIIDNAIGNMTQSYTLGSTLKPAILALAYNQNVLNYNEVIVDQPLKILGTPTKGSYINMGPITEMEAIAKSSNVYFYNALLKVANTFYQENQPLNVDVKYFDVVRNYLKQFGLGTNTGIDLENEATGINGSGTEPGLYLDLANGQYDTYTNLQQAQYAATLDSLGKRYKINYVKKITQQTKDTEDEKVIYQNKAVILNEVNISTEDIEHINNAMEGCNVISGGTCRGKGFNLTNPFEAKTGTSESFYYDEKTQQLIPTNTTSFIGTYQTKNNNKYSIAVLAPHYTNPGNQTRTESGHIAANILNSIEKELNG